MSLSLKTNSKLPQSKRETYMSLNRSFTLSFSCMLDSPNKNTPGFSRKSLIQIFCNVNKDQVYYVWIDLLVIFVAFIFVMMQTPLLVTRPQAELIKT